MPIIERAGRPTLPANENNSFIVRSAAASDLWRVCLIECASFGWGRLLFGLWPRTVSRDTTTLVAAVNAKVVGYLIAYPRKLYAVTAIYVAGIGVMPKLRRNGFGTQLMKAILADETSVWLHVRAGNTAAIEMYQHLNMHERSRLKRFYTNGEDALIFVTTDLLRTTQDK